MRFRRQQKGKLETVASAVTSTPAKLVGATAAIGGAGALIAKKVRGGGTPEPLDVPPAPDNPKTEAPPEAVEAVQESARQMAAADARAGKSGPTID